jgi:hypothetical protein
MKFGTSSDLCGRPHIGPAADAGYDPFALGQPTSPLKCIFIVNLNDFVNQ